MSGQYCHRFRTLEMKDIRCENMDIQLWEESLLWPEGEVGLKMCQIFPSDSTICASPWLVWHRLGLYWECCSVYITRLFSVAYRLVQIRGWRPTALELHVALLSLDSVSFEALFRKTKQTNKQKLRDNMKICFIHFDGLVYKEMYFFLSPVI